MTLEERVKAREELVEKLEAEVQRLRRGFREAYRALYEELQDS